MKKHSSTILLVLIFFVGLSVMLYPTISDFWNEKRQSKAIVNYQSAIENMKPEDYSAIFKEAENYNKKLENINYPLINGVKVKDYDEILNVNGNGMMGYITIPKIKVELPVYHGTSDAVLNVATGHLQGTSLPVGGKSTHCVLSAHRGLPSAKLFTNLDKMAVGDTFTITVLDRVLTYEVDQIVIVLPQQVNDIYIEKDKDYCTLVTCTPYGINTHRLLVRGKRIATPEPEKVVTVITDAYQIDPMIVTPAVAAPMLGLLLIYLLIKYRKKGPKHPEPLKSDMYWHSH